MLSPDYEYDRARIALQQALVEQRLGHNKNAYFLLVNDALPVFQKYDEFHLGESCQLMSYIFSSLGENHRALEYYERALSSFKKAGIEIDTVSRDIMRALISDDTDKSISLLEDVISNKNANPYYNLIAYINLIAILNREGRFKEAYRYVEACRKNVVDKNPGEEYLLSAFYLNAAACMFELKNYTEAIAMIEKAEPFCEANRWSELLSDLYLMKARILDNMGCEQEAYRYMLSFISQQSSEKLNKERQDIIMMHERDAINKSERGLKELQHREEVKRHKAYIIILIISILSVILGFVVYTMKSRNEMQQLENLILSETLDNEMEISENRKHEIEDSKRKISTASVEIANKNRILLEIKNIIEKNNDSGKGLSEVFEYVNEVIGPTGNPEESWEEAKIHFEAVHPGFFTSLKSKAPKLSENELRLCVYIYMGMRAKEIAALMRVTPGAVNISRYRIRKKLNLSGDESLEDFLRTCK